jgi:biotin transport system permease protein
MPGTMNAQPASISPPASGGVFLQALDPRLKVVLAAGLGLLTWRAGPVGLAAYAVPALWCCAVLGAFLPSNRRAFRAYGLFVLFWMAVKLGLDLLPGPGAPAATLAQALPDTLLLGARLALLISFGLCLALASSPRQLGLALAWFLRPVLRRRAWRAALALALMVHFLPLAWEAVRGARRALSLRAVAGSRWRRGVLLVQVVLRALAQKTWHQTVALAARGLDREEAWRPRFQPQPRAWASGALLLSAAAALALV